MQTRRCFKMLSVVVAALWIAAAACAQNPPTPLGNDVISAVQLTPQQTEQVRAYVAYWANLMNADTSSPADVERARDTLMRPLTQPGSARLVSPNFRGTYSKAVVPEMETALKSANMYRAVNATLVLAPIGTDAASALLLANADLQNQPVWQVRLQAANGERILLQGNTLESRKVLDAAKKLRDAIAREDNGMALRHQFGALRAAADVANLQPADQTGVRTAIADAVASVVQKIAAANNISSSMVIAVATGVGNLREAYRGFPTEDKAAVGPRLGPPLGNLVEWSGAHWDEAHADKALSNNMGSLVGTCEGMLQYIDPIIAPKDRPTPTSDMKNAWTAGDKAKFDAGVQAWKTVLGAAPYKP